MQVNAGRFLCIVFVEVSELQAQRAFTVLYRSQRGVAISSVILFPADAKVNAPEVR